jgi:predicted Zn-dependent protease
VGAQIGGQLLSLKFSRDDESEADALGLVMAAKAGYDPRTGVTLWQKMIVGQRRCAAGDAVHPPQRAARASRTSRPGCRGAAEYEWRQARPPLRPAGPAAAGAAKPGR